MGVFIFINKSYIIDGSNNWDIETFLWDIWESETE